MSLALLNRLPIPNLKHYCWLSFALLTTVVLHANRVLYNITNDSYIQNEEFNSTYIQANGYVYTVSKAIINEPWCIWVLINCCYCALLLFSKLLQKMIFGDLRMVEYQHIKDQFWNFIFLKFIFIFGVLNLESANEVGMWCTWFSIIGFLALHSQICKDRYDYMAYSTSTPLWNHIKVIGLLNCIICLCMGLIGISILVELNVGFNIGLFMFTEAFTLTIKTLYVVIKYSIHLWDVYYVSQWENKGTVSYYTDFIFEIAVIVIEFLHYIHMLLYGNFFLSMASIVICMELRRLFNDFKKRMKRHSNYLIIVERMEKKYPWANKNEFDDTDKCAVCWEKLDRARKLPCSHMFHHNCLRAWLEQDTSCPTCRLTLQDVNEMNPDLIRQRQIQRVIQQQQPQGNQEQPQEIPQQQQQQQLQGQQNIYRNRNFFHFDGSRYLSWLPTFSIEVNHNLGNSINLPFFRQPIDQNRLDILAQQVLQVFPHVPLNLILEDLRLTHSAEITIDNILNERLNLADNAIDTESDESESDNNDDSDISSNQAQATVAANTTIESSSILSANETSIFNSNSENLKSLYLKKKELIEKSKQRFLSRIQNEETSSQPTTSSEANKPLEINSNVEANDLSVKNLLRRRHDNNSNDEYTN